jgi:hypothetical protein
MFSWVEQERICKREAGLWRVKTGHHGPDFHPEVNRQNRSSWTGLPGQLEPDLPVTMDRILQQNPVLEHKVCSCLLEELYPV